MQAIMKFVGKQHYPWPQDHINETRKRGPSIRIPPDSIPDLDTPYPVLFVHPRGTFLVTEKEMKLPDFFEECKREEHIIATPPENEYIQDGLPTLEFISTLQRLHDHDRAEYNRLVDKYGIEFHYAVTHYSWITRTQLVVGEDGEGLERAEELEGMGLDFEIVQVIRVKEGGKMNNFTPVDVKPEIDNIIAAIPDAIAQSCYEVLEESQPSAIPAIKGLLLAGETPTRIYNAVMKQSHGNEFISGLFCHAAEWIVKEELLDELS